jgi:hypothetical protein
MGLRNLTFAETKVEIPGGDSFTVRGLSPDMVVSLYQRHAGQLSMLFDRVMANAKGETEAVGDVQVLAGMLIGQAPEIMAELVALASGSDANSNYVDPDVTVNPLGLTDWHADVAAARRLPLPVQVDALVKVAEMTFSSSMPPGKFLAVIVQMAGATTAALSPPKN